MALLKMKYLSLTHHNINVNTFTYYIYFTVPPFDVSLSGPTQGEMVGNSLMIQCTASGMGLNEVTISWMGPGGDTITDDSRVTITSTDLMSELNFMYLMEGDDGTYTCNVMTADGARRSESVEIESLTSKLLYIVDSCILCLYIFMQFPQLLLFYSTPSQ